MPTYDYHCSRCKDDFEVFQSMKDAPLNTCPKCGKKGWVKRQIGGGSGLIFKGTGFYITDYKNKPAGNGEPKPAKEPKPAPVPAAP